MSATSDIVIIGGGIIGLSVADRLAGAGAGVTVLERGTCGRESSWAAAGVLKPGNPNRRGPMQQLHRDGLDMFPEFCADLRERSGIDPEYLACGSLELLFDDQRFRMARSEERAGAERGMLMPDGQSEWQMLAVDDARELEPLVAGDCRGVLLNRFSAQVRNPRLLQALIKVCRARGVRILEKTPATGLALEGDRVTGVLTEAGPIPTGRVVVCAGAWSSQIAPALTQTVPTSPVRGQVVLLDASGASHARFEHIVTRKGCYLVPRSDGLVLVGATVEHESGFDRRTTAAGVSRLMQDALSLVPGLADAGVAAMWTGLRPVTPDRRPVVGPVPGVKGLLAATGHYRTGLALAPVTAEIVADLVLHGGSERDASVCLPERFT